MSDWAKEKANEVLAKWYGTDPDEPGEGPTNAMLLSYLAQALREARAEGMREAAAIAQSWTPRAPIFYNNETRNNGAIAAAILARVSGEESTK